MTTALTCLNSMYFTQFYLDKSNENNILKVYTQIAQNILVHI